jgi:uncharacterized protein YdeI (BOF family)
MDKVPNYRYAPESDTDTNKTCPVEIIDGEFAGIVFRYGTINVSEHDNDNVKVTMELEIVKGPENFNKDTPEFTNAVGEIFVKIIEEQSERELEEAVDLEDDVHTD